MVLNIVSKKNKPYNHQRGRGRGIAQTPGCAGCSQSRVEGVGVIISDIQISGRRSSGLVLMRSSDESSDANEMQPTTAGMRVPVHQPEQRAGAIAISNQSTAVLCRA